MRYLNKIVFINSAHVPYAEIKLDGNVHFIGTQGVGKSTLLRAILFFYNADKLRLGIPKEKKGFDLFYFPYDNSYIVYEVMRENGAYCVLAMKSMKRVAFRFIDAPYCKDWFMNEGNEAIAEWPEIRKRIPTSSTVSSLVNDYYVFRDIIFGNNKSNELLPFRKYAIVESSNYQNIPRTIQNVFLNSKLDADFIKDTIIKSMNEEEQSIDLNVYRSLIGTFEQEYTDVMLWLKPNKSGVVEVRKQADNVIKRYRQLLYLKKQIHESRTELNFAEKTETQYLPVLEERIKELEEKLSNFIRLSNEEKEKYNKEHDKLTKEYGIVEDKLKESRRKKSYYEQMNISNIIVRVNGEQDVNTDLASTKKALNKLTSLYQDIMDKYNGLFRELDANLKEFETEKKEEMLKVKEQFTDDKSLLNQKRSEHEKEERNRSDEHKEYLHTEILKLTTEMSALKERVNNVRTTLHFKDEIEQKTEGLRRLESEEGQLKLDIGQLKLEVKNLRNDAFNEIKQNEWDYNARIDKVNEQRNSLDEEIQKLRSLLEQRKGSLCEWLEQHKPDWQKNIGKVVDEGNILYNQHLNPQIASNNDQNLFGVTLDLSHVSRELRTPAMIKEELSGKEAEREKLSIMLDKLAKELAETKEAIEKKANKRIRDINERQHLFEAQLERIPVNRKALKVELVEWQNKEEAWKKQEMNRIDLLIGEKQNSINGFEVKLEQAKNDLQRRLKSISDEFNKALKEKETARNEAITEIEHQIAIKKKEVETQKEELRLSQNSELSGKGVDTTAINNYEQKIETLQKEQEFIRSNRHHVYEYNKDKREYFDMEPEFQEKKKDFSRRLAEQNEKYNQRALKLKNNINETKTELDDKSKEKKTIVQDSEELRKFKEDIYFCPPETDTLDERPTKDSCGNIIKMLKDKIIGYNKETEAFKKTVNAFSGNFSAKNTFSFPTTPVTDADYSNYAANVLEFVEENKIEEFQTRISERYANIILRISKETGELTRNESDINKTILAINNDFVERNFTGVIRSIELRAQPTNDKLMQLLLEIKRFNEENLLNLGEVNLFSQESRTDVNGRAVRFLNSLSVKLNDEPGRKSIVLSDTFNLQFRIVENDNDTGWIEKIANVGSDGTDILVKAMVNIMLINVFKEKASRKFGDFKLHCMMDEIGKLHPTNVKGILSFANCRNILLINSSPTTYNVEDYRYTYLLTKDKKSNTKVVPLLTRKR